MILDEIRGHLVILPIYKAQTRAFEGSKKSYKVWSRSASHTTLSQNVSNYDEIKSKKIAPITLLTVKSS